MLAGINHFWLAVSKWISLGTCAYCFVYSINAEQIQVKSYSYINDKCFAVCQDEVIDYYISLSLHEVRALLRVSEPKATS